MEINDFDKLVKEHLESMEIAPSSGLKKGLAFKMFFKNLLLFHKVKLLLVLFVATSGAYVGMNYFGADKESLNGETQFVKGVQENANELEEVNEISSVSTQVNEIEEINERSSVNVQVDEKEKQQYSTTENEIDENEMSNSEKKADADVAISSINKNEGSSDIKNEEKSLEVQSVKSSENVAAVSSEKKNSVESEEPPSAKKEIESDVSSNDEITATKETLLDLNEKASTETGTILTEEAISEKIAIVAQKEKELEESVREESVIEEGVVVDIEKVEKIPGGIETKIELDNSLPSIVAVPSLSDDYANDPKKRGFTIDAYVTPVNYVDIDNELDASLEEYYWDFYKEFGYVKSDVAGGMNVNYNWNNFKIGTGLQLNTFRDYKSNYKYLYLPNFMSGMGVSNISTAVVYEQDTAFVFYADHKNKELHTEIENEYNKYSCLKIPLTLGYELDLKYVSLELNAGVEYGHLIKAKGVEVKYGEVENDPVQVYFYSDKYMDLMSRKSDNLNKHQFALLANATLRVRLTQSFDFYSSFNYTQSQKGIYNEEYFLQKTYKNYGVKFGLTYYLNKRLKLKETSSTSFE